MNEALIMKQGFIIFCIVISIWKCFQPQMIFGKIGDWIARTDSNNIPKVPDWIRYPVSECPSCMAYWYGSIFYWLIWANGWVEWILVIAVTMALCTVFVGIKKK